MKPDTISLHIVREADSKQLEQLYREAGWWREEFDQSFIPLIVERSQCFVVAIDSTNDRIVGMGRAISDASSDAYIQDVTVLSKYRGQGIGSAIIRHLTSHLLKTGHDWIGLIGEPGTQSFYETLGFAVLRDYIPMKYTGSNGIDDLHTQ